MRWGSPCDSSELTHLRKRIGKEEAERIFDFHDRSARGEGQKTDLVVDTTVPEKNITFPTDTKLAAEIVR
jgi:IS5 family transposase